MQTQTQHRSTPQAQERLLRLDEVVAATGLGRTSIYRKEREEDFPQRVAIGLQAVAWRADEVHAWIAAQPALHERAEGGCHASE